LGVPQKIGDEEFVRVFEESGPAYIAKQYGLHPSAVFRRRRHLEQRLGRTLFSRGDPSRTHNGPKVEYVAEHHPQRFKQEIKNGVFIVASDFHYWPASKPTVAHRALVKLVKELQPNALIANGDVLDFPSISRWPASSWADWEKRPKVSEEIEYAQERLFELEQASPRKCKLSWPLGNHDSRFEFNIANKAPELAKLKGVHLKDYFPAWQPCWATWINQDIVIKHRWAGGVHDIHNNVLKSGLTMVTGHTHSLNVRRYTDYSGPRFGVNTGMVADVGAAAFVNYTEDNPQNWASGFVVFTIKDGKLCWPEIVHKWDDSHVEFRGSLIRV
jgi:hypothetical protein